MGKVVGLVVLFVAGLLLVGGLAATGVADVTTTETRDVTTTVEQTTTAPATTVATTVEQTTTLAPTSPTTTSNSSSSSTPTWAWIVIAILGAAVVGLLVAVFSRDRGGPPGPPAGPP
jgi:anti-sigma-K factor RskA